MQANGNLMTKNRIKKTSINRIRLLSVCCHGHTFIIATNKSSISVFAYWIYILKLNFTVLIILELFTVIALKFRFFPPEPLFQTINPET